MAASVGGVTMFSVPSMLPGWGPELVRHTAPGINGVGFKNMGIRGDSGTVEAVWLHTASETTILTAYDALSMLRGYVVLIVNDRNQSGLCLVEDMPPPDYTPFEDGTHDIKETYRFKVTRIS